MVIYLQICFSNCKLSLNIFMEGLRMMYATTKCPRCGQKQEQPLNGDGFFGKEETKCINCGQLYSTAFHCLRRISNEEKARAEQETIRQKEKLRIMRAFSTSELKEELERRSISV